MRTERLLGRILRGHVRNIRFNDFVELVEELGFRLDRVRGSHLVFVHPAIARPLPLQPMSGEAKPWQVRQLLRIAQEYNLLEEERR